ncbi:unnamed protein product [Urochloa decumbens]|uniref:PB1-like domain-containing protein n=1 Tax=Urochloa decumbens TaxID=240449 RepID=A0ABC9B1F7_9POAL
MDNLEHLAVKFFFGGGFVDLDGELKYLGGTSGMSYIEIDKISLPEIMGHLGDHVAGTDVMRLHWLRGGKELRDGLMLLVDDGSCKVMADQIITDGGVAEIYVEVVSVDYTGGDDEAERVQSTEDMDFKSFKEESASEDVQVHGYIGSDGEVHDSDTSDEEYQQPSEDDSSADDEEVTEMRTCQLLLCSLLGFIIVNIVQLESMLP